MTGVREIMGVNPISLARDYLQSTEDKARRGNAARRTALYRDDSEELLRGEVGRMFDDPAVKRRLIKFLRVANSQGLFKRVIDEISRPVYSVPPVRTLEPESAQPVFREIETESKLNGVMDLGCRLMNACNDVALYTRYVESLDRIAVDLLTPDMMTVIPHRDDPTVPMAVIYDKRVRAAGGIETWRVYWDDAVTFQFDADYKVRPFAGQQDVPFRHGYERMPFVFLHRRRRWGRFWDETTGNDLESAQIQCAILNLLSMRLLKAQGFTQLVVEGDIASMPKGQSMDEESALVAPEGVQISTLNNKSDAGHYLALMDAIKQDAAANHGLSRSRLNKDGSSGDDTGLMEQRADSVKVMHDAELEEFEIIRMVSAERPRGSVPADAVMRIDFGELPHRVDPISELDVWDRSRRMGIANVLDHIKAKKPEIRTDEQAWADLDRNMIAEAEYIQRRRALNIAEDASAHEPGQSAEANGAMGPMVKDGRLTRDEAAMCARTGHMPGDED